MGLDEGEMMVFEMIGYNGHGNSYAPCSHGTLGSVLLRESNVCGFVWKYAEYSIILTGDLLTKGMFYATDLHVQALHCK